MTIGGNLSPNQGHQWCQKLEKRERKLVKIGPYINQLFCIHTRPINRFTLDVAQAGLRGSTGSTGSILAALLLKQLLLAAADDHGPEALELAEQGGVLLLEALAFPLVLPQLGGGHLHLSLEGVDELFLFPPRFLGRDLEKEKE